jgi:ketosteroid isomerase-like protein
MDNVAIVRSGYDAFARGDMAMLLEIFDPEIEWTITDALGLEPHYHGVDAVMGFFGDIPTVWAELHVEPDEYHALGDDRVLALGVHHGRVANGRSVDLPFAHVWTLRNGRATKFMEYTDAAQILRAQGALVRPATV